MKINFFIVKKILMFFFIFCLIESSTQASKKAFIIMKVNNEIITNINIEKEYMYLTALNNELKSINKKEALNIAKESFLREKIKENELLNYYDLNNVDSKFLDETLKNLYKSLGLVDEIDFQNYLAEYELSVSEVKKKLKIEILWNQLIYEKYNTNVEIDIEKIKKKTKVNKIQKNYFLSEIFFNLDSTKKFDEIYELIKESIITVGFKNTANKFSLSDTAKLGGTIGWVSENQLSETILNEVNKLEEGEVTKPINISGGFLILKLEKKENKEISIDLEKELKKRIAYERDRQLNQFALIYFNKIKFSTKIDEK